MHGFSYASLPVLSCSSKKWPVPPRNNSSHLAARSVLKWVGSPPGEVPPLTVEGILTTNSDETSFMWQPCTWADATLQTQRPAIPCVIFWEPLAQHLCCPSNGNECHSAHTLTAWSPSADFRLMRTLMALPESGLKRNKGHVRAAVTESLSLGNAGMAGVSWQVPLASLVGLMLFPFSQLRCKYLHLGCQTPKSGFVVDRKSEHTRSAALWSPLDISQRKCLIPAIGNEQLSCRCQCLVGWIPPLETGTALYELRCPPVLTVITHI